MTENVTFIYYRIETGLFFIRILDLGAFTSPEYWITGISDLLVLLLVVLVVVVVFYSFFITLLMIKKVKISGPIRFYLERKSLN